MSFTVHKPFRKHNAEGSAPPWLDRIPSSAPPFARDIVNSIIDMALQGKKSERAAKVQIAASMAGRFVVSSIKALDDDSMRIKDRSVSHLSPIIRAYQNNSVKQRFDKRSLRASSSEPALDEAAIWEKFDQLKEYPDELSSVSVALTEALLHPEAPFHEHPVAVIDAMRGIRTAIREHQPENPVLH